MLRTAFARAGVRIAPRRFLATNSESQAESGKVSKHVEYLKKFYTPELLESIHITESLVSPKEYLNLKKRGHSAKSRIAPAPTKTFSRTDPEWDEPIVFPNQSESHTPFPGIPQMQATDNYGLKLRFDDKDPSEVKVNNNIMSRQEFYHELHKLTGMDIGYMRSLHSKVVLAKRVSCQTSKGKIPNFMCFYVTGDRNGMVGLGQGKSRESMRKALMKAHWNAIKNLRHIPRYEDRTITGDLKYKFHAVKLHMKPAPPGFGLRVNHMIFEICQAAGIKDMSGKIFKSRNRMNVIKGFIEALSKQNSLEDLAAGRGKKMVDLRKVYYSA